MAAAPLMNRIANTALSSSFLSASLRRADKFVYPQEGLPSPCLQTFISGTSPVHRRSPKRRKIAGHSTAASLPAGNRRFYFYGGLRTEPPRSGLKSACQPTPPVHRHLKLELPPGADSEFSAGIHLSHGRRHPSTRSVPRRVFKDLHGGGPPGSADITLLG